MTTDDDRDVLAEGLEFLTPLVPDPARTTRTRLRCRAQIERRARRVASRTAIVKSAERLVVPMLLGSLSLLYAAMLFDNTLRLVTPPNH